LATQPLIVPEDTAVAAYAMLPKPSRATVGTATLTAREVFLVTR
jgi:hypothetical protein